MGLAGIVMLAGAVTWLATKPWLPRISDIALGVTCVCLGALALFVAFDALQEGVFKGTVGSKLFRHDAYLAKDPFVFWMRCAMFAVPGFLLVACPICIGCSMLMRARER